MYLHVGCRNDCFSPACSSLRDSLIMEVAIARLPLRFSFQYLPYLVFPPGANVHPNRYFSPTGTCNLSLRWPGTLSISASSQLEVLQYLQLPGIREREILCHGREKFLIHGSLFNCCHNLTSLRRTFEHNLVMRRGTGLCVSNGYM